MLLDVDTKFLLPSLYFGSVMILSSDVESLHKSIFAFVKRVSSAWPHESCLISVLPYALFQVASPWLFYYELLFVACIEDGHFLAVGKFYAAVGNLYYGYLSADELSTHEVMNWPGEFYYLWSET